MKYLKAQEVFCLVDLSIKQRGLSASIERHPLNGDAVKISVFGDNLLYEKSFHPWIIDAKDIVQFAAKIIGEVDARILQ